VVDLFSSEVDGHEALCHCPQLLSSVSETPSLSFACLGGLGNGVWRGALRVAQRQAPLPGEGLCEGGGGLPAESGVPAFGVVAAKGGFAPVARSRRCGSLSLLEREEISRVLVAGRSFRQLGRDLGRAVLIISREVARNGGRRAYRAARAVELALDRARRPKPCQLAFNPSLCKLVAGKLSGQWSPQQIAGWLKARYPGDVSMNVPHETIYKSLFIQARGKLRKELLAHLRSRRIMRRGRAATTAGQTRGQIVDAISIRDRPAEIEDRAMPGHWEGDLLSGARNGHIATLVERSSRCVMLVKVGGKDSDSVVSALIAQVRDLPQGVMASLTWDRGTELVYHRKFTVATDVSVHFCDPKSPWQRGSNENTKGLLRQYFPNGTDLSVYTQHDLDQVTLRLNARPRKTRGFQTPADSFIEPLR
jgi:IS30 family transposase